MFSPRELVQLRVAVDLKMASLKRGMNTAREPSFKALYESEYSEYSSLSARLLKEVSDVKVPVEDVSRKKS